MTVREALDRALEALREIRDDDEADSIDMSGMAADALNEIQRGLWIETVSLTPNEAVRSIVDKIKREAGLIL